MEHLLTLLQWFSGNGKYHNLIHCMGNDALWISLTVSLDLAVAAGYVLIAHHWWVNQRSLPDMPAKRALGNMRNIFAFCGLCGYIFIPIKMFWPAWRLYDMFLLVLVYFTWKYALNSKQLKVVYSELGRSTQLAEELATSRSESKQKTAFLNALSHDLRTPLNGLLLQAEVAKAGIETGDAQTAREAIGMMQSSARASAELLDSLLQCARLDWASEPNAPSEFNLSQAIDAALLAVNAQASGKSLALRSSCPPELRIRTDHVKLERILGNLLVNAVKFTQTGSVDVNVDRRGPNVEIHVVDTGIGLSPAQQEHLFEEFYQVHNRERDGRKGFGLGLPIARKLAQHLGGDIEVASALGKGSRFSVILPGVVMPALSVANETSAAMAEQAIAAVHRPPGINGVEGAVAASTPAAGLGPMS